ncbi:MAG TPA: tetratricopeptide repeat protein [Desulfuromonadales bacterium]|nr:tetratricopeptide repeat protein [Desulfuromonadales bacterium]
MSDVYVKGHFRKGKWIAAHYKTSPEKGNPYKNYSYPGNYNPYKREYAPGSRESYLYNNYEKERNNLNTFSNFSSNRTQHNGNVADRSSTFSRSPSYAEQKSAIDQALSKGKINEALALALDYLKNNPYDAGIYTIIAKIYVLLGDYDKAIQYYKHRINFGSNHRKIYHGIASCYSKLKLYREAITNYRTVIEKQVSVHADELHTDSLYNIGLSYIELNEPVQAINYISKLIPDGTDLGHAYCERGRAYLLSGETKLALADFEKAIKTVTTDFDVIYKIIKYLCFNKMFDYAEKILLFLERIRPDALETKLCRTILVHETEAANNEGYAGPVRSTPTIEEKKQLHEFSNRDICIHCGMSKKYSEGFHKYTCRK